MFSILQQLRKFNKQNDEIKIELNSNVAVQGILMKIVQVVRMKLTFQKLLKKNSWSENEIAW